MKECFFYLAVVIKELSIIDLSKNFHTLLNKVLLSFGINKSPSYGQISWNYGQSLLLVIFQILLLVMKKKVITFVPIFMTTISLEIKIFY